MAYETKNIIFLSLIAAFAVYYFIDVQSLPEAEERRLVEVIVAGLFIVIAFQLFKSIRMLIKQQNDESSFLKDIIEWLKSKQALLVGTFTIYIIAIPLLGFFFTSIILEFRTPNSKGFSVTM
ncbi:hypothetical protein [Natribacillus halophilus]|uniref:Uncharacterized protein n=1 Tax=Natribacillus halophilus TaxID=549003 RepID=A0A1G8SE32_9BACI|nr:hypothetical protein [Natribacillus halophilus]SDJ26930.1 hypothetical protein SAMN04488123_12531 [Natribacillus halophilus]